MRKQLKFLFSIILLFIVVSCSTNSFSFEDWLERKNRSKQIDPLIRSKLLIGKSYFEVNQILGKEDLSSGTSDTASFNQKFSIQYLTGGGRWIDYERLLIRFDSGKVIMAEKIYD